MPKHAANTPSGTPFDANNQTGATPLSERPDNKDERIGLTEAFAPVSADQADLPLFDKAQSTDLGDDAPIGLTEAFAPVGEGAPVRSENSPHKPEHAGGFSYKGDRDAEYPDALESLEPIDTPPLIFVDDQSVVMPEEPLGRHGKKDKAALPAHQRKSRRMRRVLLVVVVLMVLLIAALGYYTYCLFSESQTLASQQTQEQQSAQEVTAIKKDETKDATTETVKKTEAPNLAALLGLTQDEAIATIKRGAQVSASKEVNEEGNPVKRNVTVPLTDEPADTRTGTPSVYLGLNEEGRIVQAGYSASTSALGYGTLSFVDAVKNEHIVEKTLQEAGIPVVEGAAVLPADKTTYSTYATDGTTLVKETYSFLGNVDLNGAAHQWSCVLSYDYTTANMSGNLADTIRIIYVYLNA